MSNILKFDTLKAYIKYHLYLKERGVNNELEIRFGTSKSNRITKINYDNIIQVLKSNNFKSEKESGDYILKIMHEESKMRCEIHEKHYIQEYCKNTPLGDMVKKYKENVRFMNKSRVLLDNSDKKVIPNLENKDFKLRIGYSNEEIKELDDADVISFISNSKANNIYRYINRVSFVHEDYPVRVDCSVVKMNGVVSEKNSFKENRVLETAEIYEVEIEIDNEKIYEYDVESAYKRIQYCMKLVLQGIQESFYPISGDEMSKVLDEYKKLTKLERGIFVGPSSVTLQLEHLKEENENNILKNYTVTDKADGVRKLLYVSSEGKLYMITINMQIQYTGLRINYPDIHNTLLDGEHILYDKNNEYVNEYAAFDCYNVNKESTRDLVFGGEKKSRYNELSRVVLIINNEMSNKNLLTLKTKEFRVVGESGSLFEECEKMLNMIKDSDKYSYNTDGLIFTPLDLAVGASKAKEPAPLINKTWQRSFKWKPPEFNTIDFMVTLPTTKEVHHYNEKDISQYKEINLRVGFNTRQHGILNPFKMVIDGKFEREDESEENKYMPALFYPTSPYDSNAHICHIPLKLDETGTEQMFTESNEIFGENMIVEFKYVASNEEFKKWVPLRVRYDKTHDLKTTGRNFGNAYHVANNNWHSIHRPITEEIIRKGANDVEYMDDIYYENKNRNRKAVNMRKFHNIVKSMLINYVAGKFDEPTLLDIAVGRGGDIRKWFYNRHMKFVLGIDLSQDNIENKIDGACKRYIDDKRKNKEMGMAIFLTGDTSKNIRNMSAFENLQTQSIASGIFGMSEKNKLKLGDVVFKNYGIGSHGFDIVSCQFALHYYFRDKVTLKNLFINLVECTKTDGYFIATCFDGSKIFELLAGLKKNEIKSFKDEENEDLLTIKKKYEETSLNNDTSCIGYTIEVFQESINKAWDEYLVNIQFFVRLMENYGFVVETIEKGGELNEGVESFEKIYKRYILRSDEKKVKMSSEENEISKLNSVLLFKKIRHVDVNEVTWDESDIYGMSEEKEIYNEKKYKKIKIPKKKIID